MKPPKRKKAIRKHLSEVFESYTEEELTVPPKQPEGVPDELWNIMLKEADEYKAGFKAELMKHIRNYDRATAKKATAKRAKPKPR